MEVDEFEDIKSGYRINFHFDENPFFENKVLTKEFCLGGQSGPISKSTTIEWKEGKDLRKSNKQQQQQSNQRKRPFEYKTFFDWFSDNSDPVNDEIAELLKDDLFPNPLQVTKMEYLAQLLIERFFTWDTSKICHLLTYFFLTLFLLVFSCSRY